MIGTSQIASKSREYRTSAEPPSSSAGTYDIEAWGARGGSHDDGVVLGGARIRGAFDLQAGDRITIVVGQAGSDVTFPSSPVGGGGGTFVVEGDATPLVVAGGGGSNGACGGIDYEEMYGQATEGDGNGGVGAADLATRCNCGDGSPGGGFLTDGSPVGRQCVQKRRSR